MLSYSMNVTIPACSYLYVNIMMMCNYSIERTGCNNYISNNIPFLELEKFTNDGRECRKFENCQTLTTEYRRIMSLETPTSFDEER